jgi:hypothetical protein
MTTPSLTATLRSFTDIAKIRRQEMFAAEGAADDTGFEIRRVVQGVMPQVFDRPTPFVLSGVRVRRVRDLPQTPGTVEARVQIDDYGRGKGPSQEQVLQAEVYGGSRGLKGAERRLQSAGLMLPGHFMVPSKELLAQGNLVDAYGNVRGAFIRSLLSYLQAFSTPGFTANAKPRTRDRIAARGRNANGFVVINGVQYFVSKGRGERNGKLQHLPAGIWAKRGTGGAQVYPVFLFVDTPQYKVRLRFEEIADNVDARVFPVKLAERRARAYATAR